MDHEESSHFLNDLEQRLHRRGEKPRAYKRHRLEGVDADVPDDWGGEDLRRRRELPPVKGSRFFPKLFIAAIIFFVFAAGFALYSFYQGNNQVSSENITLSVFGTSFVDGGEEFPLDIQITNANPVALVDAELVVTYLADAAASAPEEIREDIGVIDSGELITVENTIELFGIEGDERIIEFILEYRLDGSNAIFGVSTSHAVTLRSTPIQLLVDAPDEVVRDQEVAFTFDIISNATETQENVIVEVSYPGGFTFDRAEPAPVSEERIFEVGSLEPGEEKSITVYGSITGQRGERRTLSVRVGSATVEEPLVIRSLFNSFAKQMVITQSFISVDLRVGGQALDVVAIEPEDENRVEVIWRNTLPTRLDDVEVIARLAGDYDPASVRSQGFFDSGAAEIIWDARTSSELASVEPGDEGNFTFDIATVETFSGGTSLSRPSITVTIDVRARDVAGIDREAIAINQAEMRATSEVQLIASTLHYSGPISNSGPMPPEPERETTYTMYWALTNTTNTVTETEVVAILQPGVEWKGVVSPSNADISYNPDSNEVRWNPGAIERGLGLGSSPRGVYFQVGVTPSVSQVGDIIDITSNVEFVGRDTFTSTIIREEQRSMRTKLTNNTTSAGANGRVVEP